MQSTRMRNNDGFDPVVEVALHLSKQDKKLEDINEPRYSIVKQLRNLCDESMFEMVVRRGLAKCSMVNLSITFDPTKNAIDY